MRVYTYVIDHDLGFAPNPFHGVCSLATCKPKIREHAQIGDYLVGTGSKPNGLAGCLTYWMCVGKVLTFDQYWKDSRFRAKRPVMRGSLILRYGDNIYHRDPMSGCFTQVDSFHSEPNGKLNLSNLKTDTGTTDRVLLGSEYAYWGAEGPAIPPELGEFVHKTQGHKCRFPSNRADIFVTWLRTQPGRGCLADPTNWRS